MDVDLSVPLMMSGINNKNYYKNISETECPAIWALNNACEHEKFVETQVLSGADIIFAPTMFATSEHLKKWGVDGDIEQINTALVERTREFAGEKVIAGVISEVDLVPEPFGEVLFTQLMHIYRRQGNILVSAGVDVIYLNEMTSIAHARAAVLSLTKFHKPIFVSMKTDEDGMLINEKSVLSALIMLQSIGASAVGFSRSIDSTETLELRKELEIHAKIPLIVPREDEVFFVEQIPVSDEDTGVGEIVLTDENQVYNLYYDSIEGSQIVECSVDMADVFIELEDESFDVIMIEINTVDDAKDFGKNAHLSNLPFCICSHDGISLRLALMLYSGVAMINSDSSIPKEELMEIAEKYGAVIY